MCIIRPEGETGIWKFNPKNLTKLNQPIHASEAGKAALTIAKCSFNTSPRY